MKLIVVSKNRQPFNALGTLDLKVELYDPLLPTDISTLEPTVFGGEVINCYLAEVAKRFQRFPQLATTSFLVYRQRRLREPHFKMDALKTLQMLSGHTFSLVTFWSLKLAETKSPSINLAETKITLNPIPDNTLTEYVNDHNIIDCPTLLDINDPWTLTFIAKIDGSVNNLLYQLPTEQILSLLPRELWK